MAYTASEIACFKYEDETIADCILRLNRSKLKGPDMTKFAEWLMEIYPKTEDYVYITKTSGAFAEFKMSELYFRIKPDPQAFLEQMKDFDEMMEDD